MKMAIKKVVKYVAICFLSALIGLGIVFTVSAQSSIPVESYTYWEDMSSEGSRKAVYSKPIFDIVAVIDSNVLNVAPFSELNDIFVGEKYIYLLDGSESRLTLIDKEYKLFKEYTSFSLNGESVTFNGASGVFQKDEYIYICDTENERVLVADMSGNVKREIQCPQSTLIPDDFRYRPVDFAIDSQGYTYILCEGSYYGMILLSPEQEFVSFFASNDVELGVQKILGNIIERVFPNNTKKAGSESVLPYSITALCVDSNDFVYTVTGSTEGWGQKGQIKKLYHGTGDNILKAGNINFADDGYSTSTVAGGLNQDLCDVAVDNNNYIYGLEGTYGRIFMYDESGTIISAFGGGVGEGKQVGTYQKACAIALNGENILVCDSLKNSVTVYKSNQLGLLIKKGRLLTLKGDYTASAEIWNQVLEQDSCCQLAYSGLARFFLANKNYNKALEYSKIGYDRETYSNAFSKIRENTLKENFWIIFLVSLILIIGIAVFLVVSTKRKISLVHNKEMQLVTSVMFHPIDTFSTIKEKRMGSVCISAALMLLFYLTSVLRNIYGGFLFTYYDAASFNALWEFAKSVGVVVLWIVANWLVCTLCSGNGRFREIIIVICYSLIPLILNSLLQLILSNVLLRDEAAFLNIINTVAYIIFFLLLCFGSMIIHDFSFGKFLRTALFTVIGMAIVIFLLILIVILFQQFSGFLSTVIMEMSMK